MTANAAEPARGRRAANKSRLLQRLLDTVEDALEDGTYAELSIERLLEESGVARSTFYYHFDDKADLIAALAEDVFETFERAALGWMADADAMSKPGMLASTKQLFLVYWEHRTVMIAATDSAAADARIRARVDRMWRDLAGGVAGRIKIAQQTYGWRGTDPDRTAAWLIWMTERGLYEAARTADRAELDRLAAVHTDICWTTLVGS